MLSLKLMFPIVSMISGALFYYFPKILWNNYFVLLHKKDHVYLYRSNRFIGKTTMLFSLFLLIPALLPQVTHLQLFWAWFLINGLLIPLYFEIKWRCQNVSYH